MAFIWGTKTKKVAKSRLNLHDTILEGKSIGLDPKKGRKKKTSSKESSWFGEPRCKVGSKARSNSRIQFASNESKLVPRNLDLAPPSKAGLNLSRAFYISLSVIQFMLLATSWSAFLCAFILTWVVIFILFYRILELNCTWAWQHANECFIYTVWKKRTLIFSKAWIEWFGHAMPPQLRVTYLIIIPLCVIELTTHIILLFENCFWYLQRGAGSH
jgi:hypothetical protein